MREVTLERNTNETQIELTLNLDGAGRYEVDTVMVVANNLKVAGAGFGVDTNVVTFITPDGTRELPLMSKAPAAAAIIKNVPASIRSGMIS